MRGLSPRGSIKSIISSGISGPDAEAPFLERKKILALIPDQIPASTLGPELKIMKIGERSTPQKLSQYVM